MTLRRRAVLSALGGFGLGSLAPARRAAAARPDFATLTPALIAAAKQEGKIAWYTADDLILATKVSKSFETKYGISVQLERSGAERIYQRIGQEYSSDISAVDVVTTSDLGHTVSWRASGWLAPYVPAEAQHWADEAFAPDGTYLVEKLTLVIPGYNTRLVKAEDAPKTWTDLLDPKWKDKMVKGHPGYSGAITNGTFALSHLLGWDFYEKLAKQGIMQVQSATDPPMRVAQGERAVMADAAEVTAHRLISQGAPLVLIYPPEGVPAIRNGTAVMLKAPHPNAARLFMHYMASAECQAINMSQGARSPDATLAEPAGWMPLAKIKLIYNDPVDVARESEELKKHYTKLFGV